MTCSISPSVRSIWRRQYSSRRKMPKCEWSHVWLPTTCPSASIRSRSRGDRSTLRPTTKNAAWTFASARTSRIRSVAPGVGPSSNVSATRGLVRSAERDETGPQNESAGANVPRAKMPAHAAPKRTAGPVKPSN
jgi:hypothetical protein